MIVQPLARFRVALLVAAIVMVAVPRDASAQEDPVEPTGQAVCNVAFTVAAALSFGNAVVPPDAPLGPNDVVVALTPVLRACVDRYPPAPPRQCVTSELYPGTGLPVTPPDPVGIVTDQTETAAATLPDPLGLALSGPLHDFFVSALRCEDPSGSPDEAPGDVVLQSPEANRVLPPSDRPAPAPQEAGVVAGPPTSIASAASVAVEDTPPVVGRVRSLVSSVPGPLRGLAVVVSGALLAGLAMVLRRQLAPRYASSLLDPRSQARS